MNHSDEFLELITEYQGRLFGFVLSMLGNVDQANEVHQEVNLVLWKKSDEFTPGSNFKAWSFRIAHFQVMAFRQRQIRDRLVFDDASLEKLSRDATTFDDVYEQRMERLETCMERLSERNRDVVFRFYNNGESMSEIGTALKRTANAVGQMLFRIRRTLIECVSDKSEVADVVG